MLIKYWVMKYIVKMNKKQHGKYVVGFREIFMSEIGFPN